MKLWVWQCYSGFLVIQETIWRVSSHFFINLVTICTKWITKQMIQFNLLRSSKSSKSLSACIIVSRLILIHNLEFISQQDDHLWWDATGNSNNESRDWLHVLISLRTHFCYCQVSAKSNITWYNPTKSLSVSKLLCDDDILVSESWTVTNI